MRNNPPCPPAFRGKPFTAVKSPSSRVRGQNARPASAKTLVAASRHWISWACELVVKKGSAPHHPQRNVSISSEFPISLVRPPLIYKVTTFLHSRVKNYQ